MNSVEMPSMVGLQGTYEQTGPYDLENHCGNEVAITILLYSLKKVNYDRTYKQF